jgi:AraC family transcriptional regulator of adaptative response / DNA-3-methyladenine glycosylase II
MQIVLPYRAPIAWDALVAFIGARAARGVEHVAVGRYARTVRIGNHTGVITVHHPEANPSPADVAIVVDASDSLAPVASTLTTRLRQLFDLDADTNQIEAHLARAELRNVPSHIRGLRVPGAFDPFELAVRAVLGQQVTVKGASTLMSRLVAAFGDELQTQVPELTHLTPTAHRLAAARATDIRAIGLPNARAATLLALAETVADGALHIGHDADVHELIRQLRALPGIGPWTAEYIAMRAVHWSDAFPVGDLALRRAAGDVSPAELSRIGEQWRPWRAYAAMHLWASL